LWVIKDEYTKNNRGYKMNTNKQMAEYYTALAKGDTIQQLVAGSMLWINHPDGATINRKDTLRIKPKDPEWHSRLFKGCPVMHYPFIGEVIESDFIPGKYGIDTKKGYDFRLPTIKESPRNTWLLHSGDGIRPEGSEDLTLFLWYMGNDTPTLKWDYAYWNRVDKFMIIDRGSF